MMAIWSPLVCCLLFSSAALGDVSINEHKSLEDCPDGFACECTAIKGHKLVLKSLTWDKAQAECHSYGAYLTIVNSEAEYDAQLQLIKDSTADMVAAGCGTHVWIGAQSENLDTCKPYVWKPDGQTQLPIDYDKWSPNEPNCAVSAGVAEHCGGYYYNRIYDFTTLKYYWNDQRCHEKNCFICEIGPFA